MVELGQLEKHHQAFDEKKVRIIVISNDDQPTAQSTQSDFPHLTVVADTNQNLAKAMQVIHLGAGSHGEDTNAPTTFLIDGSGRVCWFRRPERFLTRLSPSELLRAIDETWRKS